MEREAADAAAQAKLDIEQRAEAAMAAASSHSEVYAEVSVKDISKAELDRNQHICPPLCRHLPLGALLRTLIRAQPQTLAVVALNVA